MRPATSIGTQLSQALDRPLGLKGVTNPLAATGGVDPEVEEHARVSIPIPVQTLGRAVSLLDYADFALAFTGIAKAQRRGPAAPRRADDRRHGRRRRRAAATGQHRRETRRRGRLGGRPARRGAGAPVPPGRLPGRAQGQGRSRPRQRGRARRGRGRAALDVRDGRRAPSARPCTSRRSSPSSRAVPGVVAVDLDLLYRTGTAPSLQPRLVADPARVVGGQPLATELLVISDADFDWLLEMP